MALQNKHLFLKVVRTQVFPLWKYRLGCVSGTLDRRHVHLQRVGRWRDQEDYVGVRKNYINQESFRPGKNEADRQIGFTENPLCHPCVSAFWSSPIHSHSTLAYIMGNKRKRKETDCILIHRCCCCIFFVYNRNI